MPLSRKAQSTLEKYGYKLQRNPNTGKQRGSGSHGLYKHPDAGSGHFVTLTAHGKDEISDIALRKISKQTGIPEADLRKGKDKNKPDTWKPPSRSVVANAWEVAVDSRLYYARCARDG